MITEVYIGSLKSEKFDYNKIGEDPDNGTYPEVIGKSTYDSDLFWDIIKENSKKSDWGCWVAKMTKEQIISFLSQEKYHDNNSAKHLLGIARTLEDNKEYLLVAFEDIISPPCD
ncbi:MAG: hypothetical protein VB102_12185 [Paludibacter sp.]|nr:hypothetical protein [Paludibacter sp.]